MKSRSLLALLLTVFTLTYSCNNKTERSTPELFATCDSGSGGEAGQTDAAGGADAGAGTAGVAGVAGDDASATAGMGGDTSGSAGEAGMGGEGCHNADGGSGDAGSAGSASSAGSAGTAGTGGSAGACSTSFFTTNFDLNETPLSESGAWTHHGLDWTLVYVNSGIAFGTQTAPTAPPFNDSYAYLSCFPPNQRGEGVVHIQGPFDFGTTHEVEILLRWLDGDHFARGYECNFSFDGQYAGIVRWNGPQNDFTPIDDNGTPIIPGGLHEGDVVACQIEGDAITAYYNGTSLQTTHDVTWTDGDPGVGFWKSQASTPGDLGFTSYSATALP